MYFGKMATSSTTVAGKIGYLHVEEQNWSPDTYPVQTPSPNGPDPLMQALKARNFREKMWGKFVG